jgi:transcription elongation GreA/GreB family factor
MICPGLESFRIIKTTPRSPAGGSWSILAARGVVFGATVTYVDGCVNVKTITIVGIDEADISPGP